MKDTLFAIRKTLHQYSNSGYLLIIITVLALITANSPFADYYFSLWSKPLVIEIGKFKLLSHTGSPLSIMEFINDALMAIFFFTVGLEIKREILVGELSSPKKALLPVIAAMGGVFLPITIFSTMVTGADQLRGAAIPMATDIAFTLGILSMFGKRVPIGLKIFLATLAVADDLFGIFAIAIFYTQTVHYEFILYSFIFLAIMLMGRFFRINSKLFYLSFGGVVWFLFLNSGIHPTISGVLVAFCIPARPLLKTNRFIDEIRDAMSEFKNEIPSIKKRGGNYILTSEQINLLKSVESASDKVISPLQALEDSLHPLINYIIIPLFAFANAGIALQHLSLESFTTGITPAIICGLVFGKMFGIFAVSYLFIKLKFCALPQGVNWKMLFGISALGGIGFTVSLFIAQLSYGATHPELLQEAKLAIISGSLLAGILGYLLLSIFLPKRGEQEENY